mgnify:CR=1 FL=1
MKWMILISFFAFGAVARAQAPAPQLTSDQAMAIQGIMEQPAAVPASGDPALTGGIVISNSKDLEKRMAGRMKDPFMLPNHVYAKLKKRQSDTLGEGFVDESVDPQRRWALKFYSLVAIIWNVKKPKAMIKDRKGQVHLFFVNDSIGNNGGRITAIHDGEVVVMEKGTEVKLRLK